MIRVLGLVILTGCMSSCYLTKQGYRQLSLLTAREPVDEVLRDEKIGQTEIQKLHLTKKVLAFAAGEGLDVGSAYSQYVPLKGDSVSYIVQAARPTELKLKTWWFPIVGRVPYLGFFDKEDRDAEAASLATDGYEIHKGGATAFSSLGWFSDPIYSSMLRRTDADLAHLYFHELAHRTVWLKDGVEFNENLAEFVADHMTEAFFKSEGRERELTEFREGNRDHAAFRLWIKKLRSDLEANLNETKSLPEDQRVSQKNNVISLAVSAKPAFKRIDFVGSAPWNNARILSAGLYSPDTGKFEASAICFKKLDPGSKMGDFLKALEKTAEKTANGFQALEKICEKSS